MKSLARWSSALAAVLVALCNANAIAGTVTYFHNDLLGSAIAATNASGQVVWRETYRPYGERLTNDSKAATNDVWFSSRRQDTDTGLVNMGARYYDPVTGRFNGVDPVTFDPRNIHSFNRYAYANNNPYKYTDPDGRNPLLFWIIRSTGAGYAAGVMADAASQYAAWGTADWQMALTSSSAKAGAEAGLFGSPGLGIGLTIERVGAGVLSTAEMSGILREAAAGKGNFGLGKVSAAEADTLGRAWVGEGFSTASDGATLVSADKLRIYRPPSPKPNSPYAETGIQANLEQKIEAGGRPISNGHLDIMP